MDIVQEALERLAEAPKEGVWPGLLGRALGEIGRLRQAHEPRGVVDPWTGAWSADGTVCEPVATLDAEGREVEAGQRHPVTGEVVVATHARDQRGVAAPVTGRSREWNTPYPSGPGDVADLRGRRVTRGTEIQESHARQPNPQGPATPTAFDVNPSIPLRPRRDGTVEEPPVYPSGPPPNDVPSDPARQESHARQPNPQEPATPPRTDRPRRP